MESMVRPFSYGQNEEAKKVKSSSIESLLEEASRDGEVLDRWRGGTNNIRPEPILLLRLVKEAGHVLRVNLAGRR